MRTFFALIFAAGLLLPPFAFAAATSSCTCYCGTPESGAVAESGTMEIEDCVDRCAAQDKEYAGCFTTSTQFPRFSALCWTEPECEDQTPDFATTDDYQWVDETIYCEDKPEPMGFCYPPPRPVTLMVALGSVTSAKNIGEYVDALYRLLVPAMTLVAVVMLMIAGLQYMLARGNADAIKKAKDRMTKAVIGLVLLLSAYTIARFLDPRLVNIKQLRTPQMKEVLVLDDNDTCEYLSSLGYEIDDGRNDANSVELNPIAEGDCGTTGTITGVLDTLDPRAAAAGVWEEGDECRYSTCPNDAQACTTSGECVRCTDVYTGDTVDVDPSDATCRSLSKPYDFNDKDSTKYICRYNEMTGGLEGSCVAIADTSSIGDTSLNCSALRSQANASCRSYDTIFANHYFTVGWGNLLPDEARTIYAYLLSSKTYQLDTMSYLLELIQGTGNALFEEVCGNDICGLSPGKGSGGCKVSYQAGYATNCVAKKDVVVVDANGVIMGGTCYTRNDTTIACVDTSLLDRLTDQW